MPDIVWRTNMIAMKKIHKVADLSSKQGRQRVIAPITWQVMICTMKKKKAKNKTIKDNRMHKERRCHFRQKVQGRPT